MSVRIPFVRLAPAAETDELTAAVSRVVRSGRYVLGSELEAFEREFAAASHVPYAVGVGNGTDAIAIVLRALGIGPGDEVVTTPLSAAYTALAILMVGARPVFADVDPIRLTIDPKRVEEAIGPRTAALLPVHLYGQAADLKALESIADRHGLALVEDCCQAHFGQAGERPVGTVGVAGAFSFYPTKNLAALGDAGAVVTRDPALADRVRKLRHGGQSDRYHHEMAGVNSRLDEIQAAVLRVRLKSAADWTMRRRSLAKIYRQELSGAPLTVPPEIDGGHVYHLFPVLSPAREELREHLAAREIETLIHYPVPIPRQEAFAAASPAACPEADRICGQLLSLPLYPGLTDDEARGVAAAARCFSSSKAVGAHDLPR